MSDHDAPPLTHDLYSHQAAVEKVRQALEYETQRMVGTEEAASALGVILAGLAGAGDAASGASDDELALILNAILSTAIEMQEGWSGPTNVQAIARLAKQAVELQAAALLDARAEGYEAGVMAERKVQAWRLSGTGGTPGEPPK